MLLMRAWGSRAGPADAHDARPLGASVATQKTTKKKPFTGGTRGSAALASGLILLRRRPEASKAIPGTTRAKRSAFARSFGDLALPDLMATACAADPSKLRFPVRVERWGCVGGGGGWAGKRIHSHVYPRWEPQRRRFPSASVSRKLAPAIVFDVIHSR